MSVVLSRRGALMVPVLVVAGGAAACSKDPKPDGGGAASGSGSASASAGASSSVVLETSVDAVPTRVEVGPLVRMGKRSVLRVQLTTEGERISVMVRLEGWSGDPATMQGIMVMSLTEPEAMVWGETDLSAVKLMSSEEEKEGMVLMPTFGEIPAGLGSVTVLLPNLGVVAGVPVVDEAQAGFDAAGAIEAAKINDEIAGPFVLSTFTAAADGSSETSTGDGTVTVTVSGDVAFATDSADLSAEADAALASVTEQLGLYPSGGTLTVTGHTDDVADDAYNQGLSERRAQAVADRLGSLTDLSKWSVSVVGKGESEPRAEGTSEEARAANRRVEVLAEPTDPSEAERAQQERRAQGAEPETRGVVGTGAQGVDVPDPVDDKLTLHLALPRVQRVGSWLIGNVELTPTGNDLYPSPGRFKLPNPLRAQWGGYLIEGAGTDSFTLLQGGTRVMAAQFKPAERYAPTMTYRVAESKEGGTILLGAVWPDTGQDTVTLDLPGFGKDNSQGVVARLTDIPVEG